MTRFTPLWLQQGSYPGGVDRRLIGSIWPTAACTGCAVSAASAMIVNIATGSVAVPTPNSTGSVLCVSDAVEQVTLAAAPGAGTNRIDLVVCQARGNDLDGGANNDFVFAPVTGTAAASPTAPAVPPGAVALAQILVTGGSASITPANITDTRPSTLTAPAAAPRVLAEVIRTSNSQQFGTALTAVPGHAFTFAPVAGRSYYMRHAANFLVSTSGFPQLAAMVPNAAGAQYGLMQVVQANLVPLWFDLTTPLLLPTGAPITLALCAKASTGTVQIQGAATGPGLWQILERDGPAATTV